MNYEGYIRKGLEILGYKRIEFPKDNDSRLRVEKIKSELGLEGKFCCLFFDEKGLVIYMSPKEK